MNRMLLSVLLVVLVPGIGSAGPNKAVEALKPFNDLVGSWRGTATPEGTREQKQRGFWTETLTWGWRFKGDDAWLALAVTDGKYFKSGELRPLPEKDRFEVRLATADGKTLVLKGPLTDKTLTLDQIDETTRVTQRLVLSLLHPDRVLYRWEVKTAERAVFTKVWQLGATKEGAAFASGGGGPVCIVSGGRGTIAVNYRGKTYHVCCSGCRDAFMEDPELYLKENGPRPATKEK